MNAADSSWRTWMKRTCSWCVRSASMMPLMPSPGSPKTVSTPQSISVSTSTSAAVLDMVNPPSSLRSADGRADDVDGGQPKTRFASQIARSTKPVGGARSAAGTAGGEERSVGTERSAPVGLSRVAAVFRVRTGAERAPQQSGGKEHGLCGLWLRRRHPRRVGGQRRLVGSLPGQIQVRAAEVTVSGGLPVDRAAQVERADDRGRPQVEVGSIRRLDLVVGDLARCRTSRP